MTIREALQELADLITAAGVPASIDPGLVNAPGAWIHAATCERDTLGGGYLVRAHVELVVPDYDVATALDALDGLLAKVLTVAVPDDPVKLDQGLALADGSMLPAWSVPIDLTTTP